MKLLNSIMGISVPLKGENEVVKRPVVIALDAHADD